MHGAFLLCPPRAVYLLTLCDAGTGVPVYIRQAPSFPGTLRSWVNGWRRGLVYSTRTDRLHPPALVLYEGDYAVAGAAR